LLFTIFNGVLLFAQDSLFITRSGSSLSLGSKPFYTVGVNCYYLQNLAAYGDTVHLIEIFQEAKLLGVTTIRTWGFFDSPDSANPAVIQFAPARYNERGLKALDYVISKAKEYSIRLLIPLVNNWEDYGGMNRYVSWYANQFPASIKTSKQIQQKIIQGVEGRLYRFHVSGSLTHDDFYTNTTIRQWYKDYISMLINRINTVTNIQYKNEPTILAWELANEPRSSDPTGAIVEHWLDEMSAYLKSIDNNHLISTGEEGLDISDNGYSNARSYNDQSWLFDGSGGISFRRNISLPNIDIASIHSYPDAWGLTGHHGILWLTDHNRIANEVRKPLILGEAGKWSQRNFYFDALLNEIYFSTTAGVLLWQFVYDGRINNDGYAFAYPADRALCDILQKYALRFSTKGDNNTLPSRTELFPNYPNPFNNVTLISYNLSISTHVRLIVYDASGRSLATLVNQPQPPGHHLALFDAGGLSSGVYFIRLIAGSNNDSRKMLLLK
jgi:mannan endo-1,4-beta-mannosidase